MIYENICASRQMVVIVISKTVQDRAILLNINSIMSFGLSQFTPRVTRLWRSRGWLNCELFISPSVTDAVSYS